MNKILYNARIKAVRNQMTTGGLKIHATRKYMSFMFINFYLAEHLNPEDWSIIDRITYSKIEFIMQRMIAPTHCSRRFQITPHTTKQLRPQLYYNTYFYCPAHGCK